MPNSSPTLVWFRQDLRLTDNPALAFALGRRAAVIPVYIWSPQEEGEWVPGAASRWWLHHSLHALDGELRRRGSRLLVRRGPTLETLRRLVRETGADAVVWNRRYEPAAIARDAAVKQALLDDGIEARSFNGNLLTSPLAVRNRAGEPFRVFTPFWKHVSSLPLRDVVALPNGDLPAPDSWPASESIEALELLPKIAWDGGLREAWTPGEAGAQAAWKWFREAVIDDYSRRRDHPSTAGTSRLSPHLHFGEISPVQIFADVRAGGGCRGASAYLREVAWREFAYHLLFHFPHTATEPLRPEFQHFPWRADAEGLRAWRRGRTGYPIVDAGMRELWHTGWMHNRVRMIVASFLVKHLLIPWQEGARWFWDTLVDADLASNTLGWQWTAGCGADAAPYFRIFNPILQGRKFDPDGEYVRRWVPELKDVPAEHIHAPWEAPSAVLASAGVQPGRTYPRPIVDHAEARKRALAAWEVVKEAR